jgi:SAM-dependent methyltransferase
MLKFLRSWWREQTQERGVVTTTFLLFRNLWSFLRDSTPERRRQRYGDMEYDWEHRVNTTSGTLGWRERLLGTFHSPYQPTDPALFQEMMSALPIQFDQFTFIDIGSGKGRTLLMASEYPFRKIIGVELLPELNQVAQENLRLYQSESQKCFALESACADATNFSFPAGPLVLYLFNPLPESGLRQMLINLDRSLTASPRPAYVLYHNPLLEHVLAGTAQLTRLSGTESYSLYRSSKTTRTH